MKERIDLLIHKYWEGATSLEEEKELKQLLRQVDGYASTKEFFLGIYEFSQINGKNPEKPVVTTPFWKRPWLGYAASIALAASVAYGIFQYQQGKAEREAYEQVVAALSLLQENMQKGSASMEVLHELRHLQTPINLFDTKK
jgi:hypothetical protein